MVNKTQVTLDWQAMKDFPPRREKGFVSLPIFLLARNPLRLPYEPEYEIISGRFEYNQNGDVYARGQNNTQLVHPKSILPTIYIAWCYQPNLKLTGEQE